jgi:hypothetical protein
MVRTLYTHQISRHRGLIYETYIHIYECMRTLCTHTKYLDTGPLFRGTYINACACIGPYLWIHTHLREHVPLTKYLDTGALFMGTRTSVSSRCHCRGVLNDSRPSLGSCTLQISSRKKGVSFTYLSSVYVCVCVCMYVCVHVCVQLHTPDFV